MLSLPVPPCAVFTSSVGKESAVTVAVLSVWPIIIEATKTLNKDGKDSKPALFPWVSRVCSFQPMIVSATAVPAVL